MEDAITFIGLDAHKATVAIGVASEGHSGEVQFLGEIPNQPAALARMVEKPLKQHPRRLSFC